jgi:diguanylate cyclase (GGDEF)-like protein
VGTTLDLHYLESQMRHLASYDVLTDVYTRRLFLESCEHLLSLMQRDKKDFVFAYIDLDDFKQINDVYGHAAGDEVLKAFSVLLRSQVRKSDLVGRMGGEEFGLALPETDRKGAEHLLEEVRLLAKQTTVEVDGREIGFTISIGFTYTDGSVEKPLDKLIKKADAALYMAKGTGKDRIHYVNCH